MDRPHRWGLLILLPFLATGFAYTVARMAAPAPALDAASTTATTAYPFVAEPVTVTTPSVPAPEWKPRGVADALRQIAELNCEYGRPEAIPHLGVGLYTSMNATRVPPCPGAWRSTTTVRPQLRPPSSHPTTTTTTTAKPRG